MKISTETSPPYSAPRTQPSSTPDTGPSSFSSALAAATGQTSSARSADFTSMTRQEMTDWMNEQIRTGKMSFDESAPFMGMTMKISVETGQPVDMATAVNGVRPLFLIKDAEKLARTRARGAIRSENEYYLVRHHVDLLELRPHQEEELRQLYELIDCFEASGG